MAESNISIATQILKMELAIGQLVRRDGCTILIYADGVDLCADVYYKGANVSDGAGITALDALYQAVDELYSLAPGELGKRFDEIMRDLTEGLNDEN